MQNADPVWATGHQRLGSNVARYQTTSRFATRNSNISEEMTFATTTLTTRTTLTRRTITMFPQRNHVTPFL